MILRADARRIPLAGNSVQCVVTSPPYWGLRKYQGEQELVWGGREDCEHGWVKTVATQGKRKTAQETEKNIERARVKGYDVGAWGASRGAAEGFDRTAIDPSAFCHFCGAWHGAYGLEPTVEMYVEHTVEILREIRRVLRSDGVCFWNIGDSYNSAPGGYQPCGSFDRPSRGAQRGGRQPLRSNGHDGLKPKDLCLIPFHVALAAQADGWWVRSDIIWAKNNPMPESVTDRPTQTHEHILMFTKSAEYFWDQEAVRETAKYGRGIGDGAFRSQKYQNNRASNDETAKSAPPSGTHSHSYMGGRNLRSVWMFPSQPYPDAHFATFPEELPARCIRAATSERGACAECGAPWERIVKKEIRFESGSGKAGNPPNGKNEGNEQALSGKYDTRMGPVVDATTIGWKPGCKCGGYWVRSTTSKRLQRKWYRDRWQRKLESLWPSKPCLVFDPFAGSGTVGEVAFKMGRRFVLADLAYQEQQWERIPPMAFLMSGGPR